MINTRLSSVARPLEAVFNTYQEAPVKVLLSINVAPSVRKNGVIIWFASSTMLGSAAPA